MPMYAISADCTLTILDQGVVDGTPTTGTALNVKLKCKRLNISDSVGTVELSGFGAPRHAFRPTKGETRISADFLIDWTGVIPVTLGNYVQLVFNIASGLSAGTFLCVLTALEYDTNDERETVQRMTFMGDASIT